MNTMTDGDGLNGLLGAREHLRFEDYQEGLTCTYGPVTVTEVQIVEFAREHDPQPFHTDPAAAGRGPFGGLVASGLHTLAIAQKLFLANFLSSTASLGSPGFDELRWLAPVRPGDELTLSVSVTDARRSRSKPDRGLVRTAWALINGKDEPVMTLSGMNFIGVRGEAPA